MEIFIGIKNDIRGLGLLPIDHPFSKLISIIQHFLIFGLIFSDFASPLWACIFEAETFIQYVEAALPITASFLSALAYCRLIWKQKIIIELIREYELIIAQRESLSYLIKTIENSIYIPFYQARSFLSINKLMKKWKNGQRKKIPDTR